MSDFLKEKSDGNRHSIVILLTPSGNIKLTALGGEGQNMETFHTRLLCQREIKTNRAICTNDICDRIRNEQFLLQKMKRNSVDIGCLSVKTEEKER